MSYETIIRAPVLSIQLNSLWKRDKMLGKPWNLTIFPQLV